MIQIQRLKLLKKKLHLKAMPFQNGGKDGQAKPWRILPAEYVGFNRFGFDESYFFYSGRIVVQVV